MTAKFIKDGYFWKQPLWKRAYMNLIYWFKGLWFFLGCLADFQDTIIANDMSISECWDLSFAMQEMKMGKMYRMEIQKNGGT